MAAVLVVCMSFLPLIMVAVVASWRVRRLLASGSVSTKRYFVNALVVGLFLPVVLLMWNTIDLVTSYTPDKCGSWWLGASAEECTLLYYVVSRSLAAFVFLLGPATVLCLCVSFGVFWTAKARVANQ